MLLLGILIGLWIGVPLGIVLIAMMGPREKERGDPRALQALLARHYAPADQAVGADTGASPAGAIRRTSAKARMR